MAGGSPPLVNIVSIYAHQRQLVHTSLSDLGVAMVEKVNELCTVSVRSWEAFRTEISTSSSSVGILKTFW